MNDVRGAENSMLETENRLHGTAISQRDELGLAYLIDRLLASKWLIITITFAAAAFSIYYTLSLRNIYRAQVVVAPATNGGGGLSQLAGGNLRGLASLVGANLGANSNEKSTLALEVLQSRKFISSFVAKRQIVVPLMATKEFDPATGTLHIDALKYDEKANKWHVRNANGEFGPPSNWIIYETFKDLLKVETNDLTGITTVAVEFYSPVLAKTWANWIVADLNDEMRAIDAEAARASIAFINEQVNQTRLVGLQEVFYRLIEEQTQNLMLTHVQQEYVFKVIDPAVVPERKVGPKRALLCMAITLGGFCMALLLVLTLDLAKPSRAKSR